MRDSGVAALRYCRDSSEPSGLWLRGDPPAPGHLTCCPGDFRTAPKRTGLARSFARQSVVPFKAEIVQVVEAIVVLGLISGQAHPGKIVRGIAGRRRLVAWAETSEKAPGRDPSEVGPGRIGLTGDGRRAERVREEMARPQYEVWHRKLPRGCRATLKVRKRANQDVRFSNGRCRLARGIIRGILSDRISKFLEIPRFHGRSPMNRIRVVAPADLRSRSSTRISSVAGRKKNPVSALICRAGPSLPT